MNTLKNAKKNRAGTLNRRRFLPGSGLTVATLSLLPAGFTAGAAVISGSELVGGANPSALFGTLLNQNNLTVTDPNSGRQLGPEACVPTAVAQGLTYLENYQLSITKPDPFTVTPDNDAAVKALAAVMLTQNNPNGIGTGIKAAGTYYDDRVTGATTYLGKTGANPSTAYVAGGQYLQSYVPGAAAVGPAKANTMQAQAVAQFLASGLNAHDGVEFAIMWGSLDTDSGVYTQKKGGHFLTLESLSYNTANGTGTITFIDPNTATVYNGTLAKTTGGNLYVTYGAAVVPPADAGPDGADEEDPVNQDPEGWLDGAVPGGQMGGIISNDLLEAVPDGMLTAGLLGASVAGLLALRRRYRFSV
jgi:hypothetical protein